MAAVLLDPFEEALSFHRAGQLSQAKARYIEVLKRQPQHVDSLHLLGVIALQNQNPTAAVKLIKLAIAHAPKVAEFHSNLGLALKDVALWDDALASLDESIRLDPASAPAHFNRGLIFQALQKPELALACFEKATAFNPAYAEAHFQLGLTLQELQRPDLAVASYDLALALWPTDPKTHYNKGVALQAMGQLEASVQSYSQATDCDAGYTEAHFNQGVALHQLRQLDAALDCYRRVIALQADHAQAHSNLGVAQQDLGLLDAAVASYRTAVALKPDYAAAHHNLGLALKLNGQLEASVESYDRAIALDPHYAQAHAGRGHALQALQAYAAAIASYELALRITPDYVEAHANRGVALEKLHHYEAALDSFDLALAINPGYAEAHYNRGVALKALGRIDDAIKAYRQALELDPHRVETHTNLGVALQELQQLEEAIACYDRAIALGPNSVQAYSNRGAAHQDLMQFDAAMASYDSALRIQPDSAEARSNKALALLLMGDYAQGLPLYECRTDLNKPATLAKAADPRLWLGQPPIAGKTLLLHSEQGFGDTIQFCRYAALANQQGARVLMVVEPELLELLAHVEGVDRVLTKSDPIPEFDFHCPLPSLPLAFGTTVKTIPRAPSYLRANPAHVQRWAQRLGPKTKQRVGIAWSGNPKHKNDRSRSIRLTDFIDHLPGNCDYYVLQTNLPQQDRAALEGHPELSWFESELKTFADTAALIENMDMVISVDTSPAHLSGALGKPTWLLLPFVPDWRWLLQREDTPWYPSVHLCRQTSRGDWASAFAHLRMHAGI